MKGKIAELKVSSEASGITIERALEILAAAKKADPDASVDVIIYHVVEEREIHVDQKHLEDERRRDDEAKRKLGID